MAAQLAMAEAIGEVQRLSGSDQRVTVRAEILDSDASTSIIDDVENPYWTGVWNSARNSGNPFEGWLISEGGLDRRDMDASISALSSSESIELVSERRPAGNSTETSTRVVAPATEVGDGLRFAWWVGDEGVKAKINRVEDEELAVSSQGSNEYEKRLLAAQRYGVESMEDMDGDLFDGFRPGDSIFRSDVGRTVTDGQVALIDEELGRQVRERFHDVTTFGKGLLTNTVNGGFKEDLTWRFDRVFETGDYSFLPDGYTDSRLSPSEHLLYDTTVSLIGGSLPVFGGVRLSSPETYRGVENDFDLEYYAVSGLPNWQTLYSHYAKRYSVNGGAISPTGRSETEEAVAPVVAQFRMWFGFSRGAQSATDPDFYELNCHFFPKVVLYNPYDIKLSVTNYKLRYLLNEYIRAIGQSNNAYFGRLEYGSGVSFQNFTEEDGTTDAGGALRIIQMTPNGNVELYFPAVTLAPGEAKVFTPVAPPVPEEYNSTNFPNGIRMENADNDIFGNVYVPTGYYFDPDLGDEIVYRIYGGAYYVRLEDADTGEYYHEVIRPHSFGLDFDNNKRIADAPANAEPHGGHEFEMINADSFATTGSNPSNYVRFLADHNIRSGIASKPLFRFDGYIPSFFSGTRRDTGNAINTFGLNGGKAFTGASHAPAGSSKSILFHVPREEKPFLSLGQLRHAGIQIKSYESSYIVGHSLPSPFLDKTKTYENADAVESVTWDEGFWDAAYLVNEELWDDYFFSGIPREADAPDNDLLPSSLPNPRYVTTSDSLTFGAMRVDENAAASNLYVDGSFNVNSTSVEAWTALLQSLSDLAPDGGTEISGESPFPRTVREQVGKSDPDYKEDENYWSGYRSLTRDEARTLAEAIVEQVKLRFAAVDRPFNGLADFVNRRIGDTSGQDLEMAGTLDLAIRKANINRIAAGDMDSDWYAPGGNAPFDYDEGEPVIAGAPGYLTQGDLLSPLAPFLQARSDTFVIRAYGERQNPVTQEPASSAWCEAVLQRTHDFVDSSQEKDLEQENLNAINQAMGRQYDVVSFRWLDADEI